MKAKVLAKIFHIEPAYLPDLKKIMEMRCKYIKNKLFDKEDAYKMLFTNAKSIPNMPSYKDYKPATSSTIGKKAIVLTKEQEILVFLQYNYSRLMICRLKEYIKTKPSRPKIINMIEWYRKSLAIRDCIVLCNIRLAIDRVHKSGMSYIGLDELYSDAFFTLLAAIDGFDVSKGQKFSTYAYWSIVRAFGKLAKARSKRLSIVPGVVDGNSSKDFIDRQDNDTLYLIELLTKILDKNLADLTPCEIKVIEQRYLHNQKRPSVEEVSVYLDMKKHQVSQTEKNAMRKIRRVIERYFS